MGRITFESPKDQTTHFSHPHPLKLINYLPHQQNPINPSSSCSGCKQQPWGLVHCCAVASCSFFLHKKCFEMPRKITHPCHKDHAFTLLTRPAYAQGNFKCDACGENGDGFSYHCKPCGIDLHILCSAMPLFVTHTSHVHRLELTFGSPYPSKDFRCDICERVGENHWIYRCNLCAFDAHMSCAKGHVFPCEFSVSGFPRSAPQPPPMHHNFVPPRPAVGIPMGTPVLQHNNPFTVDRQRNELFLQSLQQIIQSNNAIAQAMQAGGAGGYGGGNGMQQLMQLCSGLNGGAGQQEFLQALMNGGAGGGGGGGLDFLGGVLGGFGLF